MKTPAKWTASHLPCDKTLIQTDNSVKPTLISFHTIKLVRVVSTKVEHET